MASEILQLNNQYLQFIDAALSLLKNITINEVEFQTAFFALKRNKSRGYDYISANIVRWFMNNCTGVSFIFSTNF